MNKEIREFTEEERKRALERARVNNNDPCDDWSNNPIPKSKEDNKCVNN